MPRVGDCNCVIPEQHCAVCDSAQRVLASSPSNTDTLVLMGSVFVYNHASQLGDDETTSETGARIAEWLDEFLPGWRNFATDYPLAASAGVLNGA